MTPAPREGFDEKELPPWEEPSVIARLHAATYSSAQVKAIPQPEWLVDGILVRGGVAWLVGKWGTGKSFYAIDLVLSVGLGQPFDGNQVHQGPVLYIAAEGAAGIGARIAAWEEHNGVEDTGAVSWLTVSVNLVDPAAVAELTAHAASLEPVLIVVDTLNRCSVGADENSARDAGIIIEQVTRLATNTGAHCARVTPPRQGHHQGRPWLVGVRRRHRHRARHDG
jgi:RecA-family ATPase